MNERETVPDSDVRDFLFLTRMLAGEHIPPEEGHLCPSGEPYSGVLPPPDSREPDLITLMPSRPAQEHQEKAHFTRLVRPDNPDWDLTRLDDPQGWRPDHPELSMALPGPGEAVALEAREAAVWVRVEERHHPLFEVWLGLGREFAYLYADHERLEEDRTWLLRYPRGEVEAEFTRRAPTWYRDGGTGRYRWPQQDDWHDALTRDEALAALLALPGLRLDQLEQTQFTPGVTVVAHVPGTPQALWSDGHLSRHLEGAHSPQPVTAACLDVLGMVEPYRETWPARVDLLSAWTDLQGWTYLPAPGAAGVSHEFLDNVTWGEVQLEWPGHTSKAAAVHYIDDGCHLEIYELKGSAEEARLWVESVTGDGGE